MLFWTVIKNIRLHYPSQRSHLALSALPASQGDIFKAARFFGPRGEKKSQKHKQSPALAPADHMAHGRKEVARRCPSEIEVPGLLNLREEETNGSLLGELALSSQAPLCLLGEWDLLVCQWIQSREWVAQCNVCKYDKPLQYYSFSFGKPLRQEMVTDPWYVNDGNAEISIWVNSYIFQPWNENLSVHIPIHTWKHHSAMSWLLL